MVVDAFGGRSPQPGEGALTIFALVIYIPDPLGRFLDDLRLDLVPGCKPHAHVSVLPPRRLQTDWETARNQARALVEGCTPFRVEASAIRVFPGTEVIYIEVGDGSAELHQLHAAVRNGHLAYPDPYPYHPHITLAQEIEHERVEELRSKAEERWQAFAGPRTFLADRAMFVRSTVKDCWEDLDEFRLGSRT
jgi:2'-5' RNA ligase